MRALSGEKDAWTADHDRRVEYFKNNQKSSEEAWKATGARLKLVIINK